MKPLPLHPIRQYRVCTWESTDAPPEMRWLSMLVPFGSFPIFFSDESQEKAQQKGLDFIEKTIRENEESYQKRVEALEKAREAKRRKKNE